MTDVTFTNISQEKGDSSYPHIANLQKGTTTSREEGAEKKGKAGEKSMINLQSKAKHQNNQQKREESETLNAVRRFKVRKRWVWMNRVQANRINTMKGVCLHVLYNIIDVFIAMSIFYLPSQPPPALAVLL